MGFRGEIKSIFHHFKWAFSCYLRPESAPLNTYIELLCLQIESSYKYKPVNGFFKIAV